MTIRIRRASGAPVILGNDAAEPASKRSATKPPAQSARKAKPGKTATTAKLPAPARKAPGRAGARAKQLGSDRVAGSKRARGKQPELFAGEAPKTPPAPPKAEFAPEPKKKTPRRKKTAEAVPAEPTLLTDEATSEARSTPRRRATAESMAHKQRDISVSEFFMKNRHLLGFDSPARALLTTVKEAIDNSLDAAEEAGILPSVAVELVELAEDRFRVVIEDNGPGIVKAQIPKVFGKLLYGSKFHRLRQSLTSDQPVLVERSGRVERLPIAALVDPLLASGEEEANVAHLRLRVPAFDPESWSYGWRPVSHVIRHPRANEVLEIETERGKRVRVTGCHSLFRFDAETGCVRAVEARSLAPGDHVIAPRNLGEPARVRAINVLKELASVEMHRPGVFVCELPPALMQRLHEQTEIVRRRDPNERQRRYFALRARDEARIEMLDDSWFQYVQRGILPLSLVRRLGIEAECENARLRSYHHGDALETPVRWDLTPALMRFLGLYVAEGHADRRQIAFTFGSHENDLVEEVTRTATSLGFTTTTEPRDKNAVRVKVFGGLLDELLPLWCGAGAKNKRVPWIVFHAGRELRQHFLDGLYRGDGHRVPTRRVLMLGSASRELIADVEFLWLLQGVVGARAGPITFQGLGRGPSVAWRIDVHGDDVPVLQGDHAPLRAAENRYRMLPAATLTLATGPASDRFPAHPQAIARAVGAGLGPARAGKSVGILTALRTGAEYDMATLEQLAGGRVTRHLSKHLVQLGFLRPSGAGYVATPKAERFQFEMRRAFDLANSDLCLLKIRSVRAVEDAGEFVYDLAVPGCENFVAGEGPLACHNSRGQQGIGISAAGMYGQMTTGKPIVITSKTGKGKPAHHFEIVIDTARNAPNVVKDETVEWEKDHGTRVEIELQGTYKAGRRSVDEYLEQVAIANPHAEVTFRPPKGRAPVFVARATTEMPREPLEIKPHPYGVELGMLQKILQDTEAKSVSAAMQTEFSRVTPKVAEEILAKAKLSTRSRTRDLKPADIERLHKAIPEVKIFAPPSACVVPIGEDLLRKGLEREIKAEFYTSTTRPPAVYRGNPFQIEVGLAYGGSLRSADEGDGDVHATGKETDAQQGPITLLRLANRVPLQYQQSSCAVFKSVVDTNWRGYGLAQPRGSLPQGPMVLIVHIASVWVPFTSESKEAVAHYDEILKEMQLALQDCGRKLGGFLRRREAERHELRRRSIFEMYIGELVESLGKLTPVDRAKLQRDLAMLARKHTGDSDEDVAAMLATTKRVAKRGEELDEDERNADVEAAPSTRGKRATPSRADGKQPAGKRSSKRGAANTQLDLLDEEA